MSNINKYKPRYTLAYLTKSKIWPYKEGYLRGFYRIRARRRKPKGIVKKYIRVAKNRKWTEARNFFRPNSITIEKKLRPGKSAYGRPKSVSKRYTNLFYIKQKLRFFHGKRKEEGFRNLFKTHLNRISLNTNSFFTALESRLDRIFFRIRLLPTIFACHQFIHYHGLEVNNSLEHSPRKEIKIGDILSVPAKAWIIFYWNVYYRVYYRRWGRYIFKRRLFKKLKKKRYLFSLSHKKKNKNFFFFSKYGRYTKRRYERRRYTKKLKSTTDFFSNYFTREPDLLESNTKKTRSSSLILNSEKINEYFLDIIIQLKAKLDKVKSDSQLNAEEKKAEEKTQEAISNLFSKVKQYQKLYTKTYLFSANKQKKKFYHHSRNSRKASFCYKKKKSLIWLFWKTLKKRKRKKSVIRLKPVHFFIPSYLHVDFRTLSAIKRKSPHSDELHYPFQISLSKTYSFYKSQGF